MKNIGLLVAVEIEAVLTQYKAQLQRVRQNGFDVYVLEHRAYKLHFVHSGAGLIKAAAAVQMLYDCFKIDFLLNFGVVGALTEALKAADTCFVSKVVHYDMDTSALDRCEVGRYLEYPDIYLPASANILNAVRGLYPNIPTAVCACADKFVDAPSKKAELHRQFGADICDMESAAVILVCDLNRIPNLLIKTVSDSITGGADEFQKRLKSTAETCMHIVDKVIAANII